MDMNMMSSFPFSLVFIGVIVLIFLLPALLMWLWNMTMPEVFRLPEIRYWQAFRLLIIASLLFGGTIGS
jgi:hypothetical protein